MILLSLWCTREPVAIPRFIDVHVVDVDPFIRVWEARFSREIPNCLICEIIDDHELRYDGFYCHRVEHYLIDVEARTVQEVSVPIYRYVRRPLASFPRRLLLTPLIMIP